MLADKNLLEVLAQNSHSHARGTNFYGITEHQLKSETSTFTALKDDVPISLGELGKIQFPFFSFGNIDSRNLFGLDEIILFSFYHVNRNRYKKVLDLGANIGLHSLVLRIIGFDVTSYEPDKIHIAQFEKVMKLNGLDFDGLERKAIGVETGKISFTRVLGNTTGSFVSNVKKDVYGELVTFDIEVDDLGEVLNSTKYDFVKMDVEGFEAKILERVDPIHFDRTDFMLEVGSKENSEQIFELIKKKKLNAFSQKTNWNRVISSQDIPSHHTEGSLFIGNSTGPQWS